MTVQEFQKLIKDIKNDRFASESLNIYGNMGDEGDERARALADALKENSSIIALGLERNNIGFEWTKALVEALESNKSLITINCSESSKDIDLRALTIRNYCDTINTASDFIKNLSKFPQTRLL